jgi:predicted RNA-binding Zn-ribbon protein involved in translation (DUF1610 family)
MEVLKLKCASCGAPVEAPAGADAFDCAYCGTRSAVNRGEGYETRQAVEKMTQAMEASEARSQSAILDELEATRAQLRKVELQQEMISAQTQLLRVQAELHAFDDQRRLRYHERRRRQELRDEAERLLSRIRALEHALHPVEGAMYEEATPNRGATGCQVVALGFLLLLACSALWMGMAVAGCHPALALLLAFVTVTLLVSSYQRRRKLRRSAS